MNLKIGTTIKNLRIKHKITQEQLATFLGVTPQAVSRWEAENGYPDVELLPSIAEFFSVSTDDILGVNLTEREKRRHEIYDEIKRVSEVGTDKSHIAAARKYALEFPSDEKIQMNLANVICQAYMWDDAPNVDVLNEAENIYRTLIETASDNEFKYKVLESLAVLYAVGYKDCAKAEQTIKQLPCMKYCREQVASSVISEMMEQKYEYAEDYIEKLTDSLGGSLAGYIIDIIPNDADKWDMKIEMLEYVISLYRFVFGENMLFYHTRVAWLYRVIASYLVAQNKYDETIDSLLKMTYHVEKSVEAKPGDKYTSPFMNLLEYPEPSDDFDTLVVHNDAWYTLQRLSHERYNQVRNMPGFAVIEERLRKIAK